MTARRSLSGQGLAAALAVQAVAAPTGPSGWKYLLVRLDVARALTGDLAKRDRLLKFAERVLYWS